MILNAKSLDNQGKRRKRWEAIEQGKCDKKRSVAFERAKTSNTMMNTVLNKTNRLREVPMCVTTNLRLDYTLSRDKTSRKCEWKTMQYSRKKSDVIRRQRQVTNGTRSTSRLHLVFEWGNVPQRGMERCTRLQVELGMVECGDARCGSRQSQENATFLGTKNRAICHCSQKCPSMASTSRWNVPQTPQRDVSMKCFESSCKREIHEAF